jgi:hypothetical protein
MPPITLPPFGSLSLEQRLANLESLANINQVGVAPSIQFNIDGVVAPPFPSWNGPPPICWLTKVGVGAYTLPSPGDYQGATMTVVAMALGEFSYSHILTGDFVVDGIARSSVNFESGTGTSITVTAVQGVGWVVSQANGVTFS